MSLYNYIHVYHLFIHPPWPDGVVSSTFLFDHTHAWYMSYPMHVVHPHWFGCPRSFLGRDRTVGTCMLIPIGNTLFCHTLISAPPLSGGPGLVGGATWPIGVGTLIPTSHGMYVVLLCGGGVAISVNASSQCPTFCRPLWVSGRSYVHHQCSHTHT